LSRVPGQLASTVLRGVRRSNAPHLPDLPARSVKVQQRSAGGSWRTLQGLIDFAVVQSYLSTATKWGLDTLDAMTRLFTTGAWLPPALTPDIAAAA